MGAAAEIRIDIRDAIDERRAWTWGNEPRAALVLPVDPVPAVVAVLLEVRATEYEEAKGQIEKDWWHHDHERAFPLLCTTIAHAPHAPRRSSRGIPRVIPIGKRATRPSVLYRLGRLIAVEGVDEHGNHRRVSIRSRGVVLAGDGRTDRMHVLRTTAHARRNVPPLFLLGGGYTLTPRGIDR